MSEKEQLMYCPRFEVFSYKGSNHLSPFKKLGSLGSSSQRESSLVILSVFGVVYSLFRNP
jgi:1,2-phenylacetyl-CoA epoxidase PaaB subunit